MSMLDIGGSNIFGDELDFLVPIESPQFQSGLEDSFPNEGTESNPHSLSNSGQILSEEPQTTDSEAQPNSGSEVQRKRSATMVAQQQRAQVMDEHEREMQSWLLDGDQSSMLNVNTNMSLLSVSGPPPASSSPNPRFKKKVKGWANGQMLQLDETLTQEDEDDGHKLSPSAVSPSSAGMKQAPLRSPIPRSASFNLDPNSLAEVFANDSRYAGLLNSNSVSSPYAPNASFNSVPVNQIPQRPGNYIARRRTSVPTPVGRSQYSGQYISRENSHPGMRNDGPLELDANFAKVQLMEMGYPVQKKDPKAYCQQVVQFICQYGKIFVGGFYLNNNTQAREGVTAPWLLSCTFPSSSEFNQYFHYNVGERFIMQAAAEKHFLRASVIASCIGKKITWEFCSFKLSAK